MNDELKPYPTDEPPPGRYGNFTMLPPAGPGNPTDEELTWRVCGGDKRRIRSTFLGAAGPGNPTDEELTWRVCDAKPPAPITPTESDWVCEVIRPLRDTVVGEIGRRNLTHRINPDAVVLEVLSAAVRDDPTPQPLEQLAAAAFRLLPAA